MSISLTTESRAGPVTAQTAFNDRVEDIQKEADETDPLTNNDTQAEKASAVYSHCDDGNELLSWMASRLRAFVLKMLLKCCDWSLTIVSCIALLSLFIYMWADLPTMTSSYKQANEHLNGTVSHSPNYVGFGKRQNLVCNSSISIGTVLPTKKTFLPYLDFE